MDGHPAAEIQQAIEEKRADVGMDRDEVLAAMGRPERKVRERAADGTDTEDWIYGHPPAKTDFRAFRRRKSHQVQVQYPNYLSPRNHSTARLTLLGCRTVASFTLSQ